MKYLALPATAAEDERIRTTAAKRAIFVGHAQAWADAYAAYLACGSNPWIVTPQPFPQMVKDALYALYDTRQSGGPIRRVRRTEGLLSCPLCGSGSTGTLDHLLPRAIYPEFAIMRANLVPACSHCNSASKGELHRGPNPSERFIHPYFDAFADHPLWRIRFNPPYAAATFDAVPEPGLPDPQDVIVGYHLKHVLGFAFATAARNSWSTYPRELQIALQGQATTPETAAEQIAIDLERSLAAHGVNAWRTAFLRGLAANEDAIAHVAGLVAAYPAPPAPPA